MADQESKGMTRRDVLATGAAALAGGPALWNARPVQAQPSGDDTLAPAPPPAEPSLAPEPNTNLRQYLRDTSNDAWRQKVIEGEALAEKLAQVERIDPDRPLPPGLPGEDYTPVITPNNSTLPFKIVDGVKVFHLIAEEVKHQFAEGLEAYAWGYNGHTQGPTIEVVEGDRVRIYLTNRLPAPTGLHSHGFILPNGMDGVDGLTGPVTLPGETFKYEYTVRQHGTFMYHSHHNTMTQEGMGLTGMYIVHPRRELHQVEEIGPPVDRDFVILLQEWRVDVGAMRIDPFATRFNLFTMNGRVFPDTEHLVVRQGQRVRFRFGNLSHVHNHPIHLHGYEFAVTAENAYRVPPDKQILKATSLIPIGRTQDWEVVALYEGDWIFHCHMTHHIMNQMGHFSNTVGVNPEQLDPEMQQLLPNYMTMATTGMNDRTDRPRHPIPPNSIPMKNGDGPYGPIPFGGMAKVFKVRADISDDMLARNADPGWYTAPVDKLALPAKPNELQRDGVEV